MRWVKVHWSHVSSMRHVFRFLPLSRENDENGQPRIEVPDWADLLLVLIVRAAGGVAGPALIAPLLALARSKRVRRKMIYALIKQGATVHDLRSFCPDVVDAFLSKDSERRLG